MWTEGPSSTHEISSLPPLRFTVPASARLGLSPRPCARFGCSLAGPCTLCGTIRSPTLSKQNSEQSRHVPKAFRTPTSHNKLGTDSPEMDLSNSNGNRCVQIFLLREHATEG